MYSTAAFVDNFDGRLEASHRLCLPAVKNCWLFTHSEICNFILPQKNVIDQSVHIIITIGEEGYTI